MSNFGFDAPGLRPIHAPQQSIFRSLEHPIASLFHLLFKLLAIFFYLFGASNFVLTFIVCILALTFDFWTVKNVTGRLMVGLRWWNETNEDGTSEWVFEQADESKQIHHVEALIFWTALYVCPFIWVLFSISCLFRLNPNWLIVTIIGFSLSAANVYGYYRCARNAQAQSRLNNFAQSYIANSILSRGMSNFLPV